MKRCLSTQPDIRESAAAMLSVSYALSSAALYNRALRFYFFAFTFARLRI